MNRIKQLSLVIVLVSLSGCVTRSTMRKAVDLARAGVEDIILVECEKVLSDVPRYNRSLERGLRKYSDAYDSLLINLRECEEDRENPSYIGGKDKVE